MGKGRKKDLIYVALLALKRRQDFQLSIFKIRLSVTLMNSLLLFMCKTKLWPKYLTLPLAVGTPKIFWS